MPKVSVIVPVYNTSRYLKPCLDTLVHQTIDDLEIIAIDDASTDDSLKILKTYAQKYPQLKVYHNDYNLGQSITRNIGLDIAKGEYIGFVDSDDCVEFSMYETMYNGAIKNHYPDVVSSGIKFAHLNSEIIVDFDFVPYGIGRILKTKDHPEEIFWQSPSCCNKIFKREFIGKYRFLENCTWEDVAFTYSMLIKSDHILHFSDNFYIYRKDIRNGVSSKGYQVDAPLEDIFRVADEISKQAKKNHKEKLFKEIIPLIQISFCFQRLSEIKEWKTSEEIKNKMMIYIYQKTIQKYTDETNVDDGLLSSRADLMLIKKVRKMSEENVKKLNLIR